MKVRLDRLLTYPSTRVLSREGEVVRVRIEGLVCDQVCAIRSRRALARIDGVRSVRVDFESGVATIEGVPAEPAAYARAIEHVVGGKALRRTLDAARRALRRRVDDRKAAA